MPKPYRAGFRRDVVAVARRRQAPLARIAKGVGISEVMLRSWQERADVDDGLHPAGTGPVPEPSTNAGSDGSRRADSHRGPPHYEVAASFVAGRALWH